MIDGGNRSRVEGSVSRETLGQLRQLADRVLAWNRVHNLIALSTAVEIWDRHILDCLQLLLLMENARTVLDVGSGPGFPGLVLALANSRTAGFTMHLVESNSKKAAFLSSMVGEFGLSAIVHNERIENLKQTIGRVDIVTARAFSSLSNTLDACSHWLLEDGATALLQKGQTVDREIAEATAKWSFLCTRHISVVQADSVILELTQLRPIGRSAAV